MELPFTCIFFVQIFLINEHLCKINLTNIAIEEGRLKFESEIISKFMEDQYIVTIFTEKSWTGQNEIFIKRLTNDYQFGRFHYNNPTLISQFWELRQNTIMYANKIYGAIIIVRDLTQIDFLVRASANNKLVLVCFDFDTSTIKKIMQSLWNSHKHLTLITLLIHSTDGNQIIQHNPFESKFIEYSVKDINSTTNFALLLKFKFHSFLRNMAGYGIRVFIFDFPLVSRLKRNKTGHIIEYDGVDGGMVKLSKQFMNYTPIFTTGPTFNSTGLSAISRCRSLIEGGQAEVGLNARLIVDTPYNNTVYLYPIDKAPLQFVVPINYEMAPLTILAYYCFDSKSQLVISLVLIVLVVLWRIGIYIVAENAEQATSGIPLRVFGILHGIALPIPKKIFNQIIFITIAFFGLLLTSVYQGTVVRQLNNLLKPRQLNSLKDLLHSNLNITILSYVKQSCKNSQLDENGYTALMGDIGRKPVIEYDSIIDGLNVVAYNKTSTLLIPTLFYRPFSTHYYNRTTGITLLHIIPDPVSSTLISFVIRRNSPYTGVFNRVNRIYVENGFMLHEITTARYIQQLSNIAQIKNGNFTNDKNRLRPIKLDDVMLVNYFFAVNVTGSIFVFALEHVVHFIYIRKSAWISWCKA